VLGEGRYSNVNIGVSFTKEKALMLGSSRVTKTQSTAIELYPVPNLSAYNRLEIDQRLNGQNQLFNVEFVLDCRAV
jgi:hypothetical protein